MKSLWLLSQIKAI